MDANDGAIRLRMDEAGRELIEAAFASTVHLDPDELQDRLATLIITLADLLAARCAPSALADIVTVLGQDRAPAWS